MCDITVAFLKYIIKEYGPAMHTFTVSTVDCSYMFRLLQSNHYQTVYQKCKMKIILHAGTKRNFSLQMFLHIHMYVCILLVENSLKHKRLLHEIKII